VKIIDGTEIRNIEVNPANGRSADVRIGSTVTSTILLEDQFEVLRVYGGSVFSESGADSVRVFNGRLQFDDDVWNDNVLLAGGSIHGRGGNLTGGKFVDGTLRALGGLFSLNRNRENLITIDNLTMLGAATVDLRTGLRSVVLTNGIAYRGGRLKVDRGVTINVA